MSLLFYTLEQQNHIMEDPDLELVRLAQGGHADSFGVLVTRHQTDLARLLHHYARHTADLEDMVQDSFIKAWSALPSWEPRKPFLHWLKRIAVRTALEYCRKSRRSPLVSTEKTPEIAAPPVATSELASDELRHILENLSPEDQVLLTLVHVEGFTMKDAAAHLDWSLPNTKIRALRARAKLKKILKRKGYEIE